MTSLSFLMFIEPARLQSAKIRQAQNGYWQSISVSLCKVAHGQNKNKNFLICALVYKCLNNLAPNYLLSNFQRSREYHTYNTRCKDFLRLPRAKTTKYQGSFRINGARTWNALPPQIRKNNSISAFKAKLKQLSK